MLEENLNPKALDIVTYPNDLLHEKSLPVEEFDDELKQLIVDMFYTMRTRNGIGLAAVQVGVLKRIIVIHIDRPIILINPIIIEKIGDFEFEEGCLSVPGVFEKRHRAQKIRIAYQNEEGTHLELTATDLSAVCIQHEMDHLDGILFVDDLSSLKLQRVKKKVEKTLKAMRQS